MTLIVESEFLNIGSSQWKPKPSSAQKRLSDSMPEPHFFPTVSPVGPPPPKVPKFSRFPSAKPWLVKWQVAQLTSLFLESTGSLNSIRPKCASAFVISYPSTF